MPNYAPNDMAVAIAKDLLSFPITHMKSDYSFDEGPYRSHLRWIVEQAPAAVFAAGGTGEFFCLSPDEVETVVRTAVEEIGGVMPVLAAAGYGTTMAIDLARRADKLSAHQVAKYAVGDRKPHDRNGIERQTRPLLSPQQAVDDVLEDPGGDERQGRGSEDA